MDKKYAFTTAGVAQWQTDLAAAPVGERQAEAALAAEGLQSFLPQRFCLAAQQVAYLDALDPALRGLWSAQLAYAIEAGIPVMLEKPEQSGGSPQTANTKYIESEERNGTGQSDTLSVGTNGGYYLCFTIGY